MTGRNDLTDSDVYAQGHGRVDGRWCARAKLVEAKERGKCNDGLGASVPSECS